MSAIWEQFKADEEDLIGEEGIQVEAERRATNPPLYDAALSIYEYNDFPYFKSQLDQGHIGANDPTVRTGKPLMFLALVKNRTEAVKLLIAHGADLAYTSMDKDYLFWALRSNCGGETIGALLDTGRFNLDAQNFLLLVRKGEEAEVNEVLQLLPKSEFDQVIDEGDENLPLPISLLEALIEDHFYQAAQVLLEEELPETQKRLKENQYATTLEKMMEQEPRSFDFSAKKRQRPHYSKEALIRILEKLAPRLN